MRDLFLARITGISFPRMVEGFAINALGSARQVFAHGRRKRGISSIGHGSRAPNIENSGYRDELPPPRWRNKKLQSVARLRFQDLVKPLVLKSRE